MRTTSFCQFLDRSSTPWHAGQTLAERLREAGFVEVKETEPWRLERGRGYFVQRDQSSLIAFRLGGPKLRLVAAHTDSPGLRLKPRAPHREGSFLRLAVEIYGGPILATFSDRDLSLAGRVVVREGRRIRLELIDFEKPVVRLPNLPIHINRHVNEEGLKFDKQNHLHLILEVLEAQLSPLDRFKALLAELVACPPEAVLGWELLPYEAVSARIWGTRGQFLASGRLDNLGSCFAAIEALIETESTETTPMAVLFDHEEVGSIGFKGAESDFLLSCLRRLAASLGQPLEELLPQGLLLSADMAHAFHPNFPDKFDVHHRPMIGGGVVIKENANLRYLADPVLQAVVLAICEEEGIPYQFYVHRNDIPCGSTIGPMAARLGFRTLDVGMPLWAMHSVRECMGTEDLEPFVRLLTAFYRHPAPF